MQIQVFHDTFVSESAEMGVGGERHSGRVRALIGGVERVIEAWRYSNSDTLFLRGFVGTYRTSPKMYCASVTCYPNGTLFVNFGRDDRSSRFQKSSMIRYSPEEYSRILRG